MKIRKKIGFVILAAVLMLAFPTSVSAAYVESPWIYTVDGGSVSIKRYTGSDANPVVPWTLAGMDVKKIETESFKSARVMVVYVPDNNVSIEYDAFPSTASVRYYRLSNIPEGTQDDEAGSRTGDDGGSQSSEDNPGRIPLPIVIDPNDPHIIPIGGGNGDRTPANGGDKGGDVTDAGNTSGDNTTGGNTTGGKADGGNTTDGGNTSGGKADGGNTSGGKADGGNTDGGNTTGGKADGGNTTGGGNTSGGNTTGGKADGGNTIGGTTNDRSTGEDKNDVGKSNSEREASGSSGGTDKKGGTNKTAINGEKVKNVVVEAPDIGVKLEEAVTEAEAVAAEDGGTEESIETDAVPFEEDEATPFEDEEGFDKGDGSVPTPVSETTSGGLGVGGIIGICAAAFAVIAIIISVIQKKKRKK